MSSSITMFDIPPLDVSVRSMAVVAGAGVHRSLTNRLSGHARIGVAYANAEIESSGFELTLPPELDPFGVGPVPLIESPDRTDETSIDLTNPW